MHFASDVLCKVYSNMYTYLRYHLTCDSSDAIHQVSEAMHNLSLLLYSHKKK